MLPYINKQNQNPYGGTIYCIRAPCPGSSFDGIGLMNLNLAIDEVSVEQGSRAHFNFTDGDALKGTTFGDAHKEKGGILEFTGATGK